jgi:hypothetical protein
VHVAVARTGGRREGSPGFPGPPTVAIAGDDPSRRAADRAHPWTIITETHQRRARTSAGTGAATEAAHGEPAEQAATAATADGPGSH